MAYRRVIPRDLFNEGKLLKCLGQLALIVHEGQGVRWPLRLVHECPEEGFRIEQDPDDGSLYCDNLSLYLGEGEILLSSAYSSKRTYQLLFVYGWVLTDEGELTEEFTAWLDRLLQQEQT